MRERFPTANELAYDYGHSVVIAYTPDRGIHGVASISIQADGVRLYLMHGPRLPDPKKLLLGSGKAARFIQVRAASQLAHPDVKALISAAVSAMSVPLPAAGQGSLTIKQTAASKRASTKTKK